MAIKIYVDQGHNPVNPNAGAEGNGLREQNLVYAIGIELAELLRENPNFEVRLSRPSPETQLGTTKNSSLAARVNDANSWGADYFISIHCNANENPAINGSEIYVYREGSPAAQLARRVLDAIVARVGTKDNGVRVNPSLYVLRRTRMPAILVELAYITNAEDVQKLVNDQYAFAYAIYEGLCAYFGFTPTVGR